MEGESSNTQGALVLRSTIEKHIKDIDQERLFNLDPLENKNKDVIIHIGNILADCVNSTNLKKDDTIELANRIPGLRQSSERLADSYAEWYAKRNKLIEVLNSSAQDLDKRFTIVTTSRLIGSILDLLYNVDSIFGNKISHNIITQAFGISQALGVASLFFFKCLPHFAYMGLVAAFFDISYGKRKMRDILNVNEEDIKSFEKIEKWIQETEELNFKIKQIFPNGFRLAVDIAMRIENILSSYKEDTKIFTTAVFSNLQNDPTLFENGWKLYEIFTFCKTEAAKEWYDRSVRGIRPISMEVNKLEHRNQLIQFSLAAPEIPLEIAKLAPDLEVKLKDPDSKADGKIIINVKLKFIPHLVLGALNCFHIYSSYKELVEGIKHQHSNLLRDMAKEASIHKRKIYTFMIRCNTSRQLPE